MPKSLTEHRAQIHWYLTNALRRAELNLTRVAKTSEEKTQAAKDYEAIKRLRFQFEPTIPATTLGSESSFKLPGDDDTFTRHKF